MREVCLGERLRAAARFVRQGAVFADVGTDHAYLPLFLLSRGIIERAVCSDINEGPLNTARANAEELGYTDRIEFVLTDGARALKDKKITDLAICGMGGELIARIIEDAPFLKSKGTRLILEPMSRQAHLRGYLAGKGFATVAEEYVTDSGKHYLCIVAEFDGAVRDITPEEAEIGKTDKVAGDLRAMREYFLAKRRAFLKARDGKKVSGEPTELEDRIIPLIDNILDRTSGGSL